MRIVLDTDVIVAALRSPGGASAAVLKAVRRGKLTLLASVPLFIEYEAVCMRAEHRHAAQLSIAEVRVFLDTLAAIVEPITTYYLWRPKLRDPTDEMVLEAAVNGSADVLASFNARHFGPTPAEFGIQLLTPSETLRRIT